MVDSLTEFYQNLGVILNELSFLGLQSPEKMPHFFDNFVFLESEGAILLHLVVVELLQLLIPGGTNILFIFDPGLYSFIDLGHKLIDLLPALLHFFLHGLFFCD